MGAAEKVPSAFDAVADHLALTVLADGGELVDRTLEAVEDVPVAGGDHLEAELVIILANLALCHVYETGHRLDTSKL